MASKIAQVEIWGFESHVDTVYEVSDFLTVVTGETDGGKTSATLRAIRWVANGEPAGEEFLHAKRTPEGEIISQAEEVGVKIILNDGSEVMKVRRKGKTKYWVTGYDEPFEKAEVPEAVKELLGIRSTVYGKDADGKPELEYDLNFAYQLAAPFLISSPASATAKVLGKMAGTEAIDQALKSVSKDTHAARSDKAAADKEYERHVMKLLDYMDLEDLQKELDACEWIVKQIEADLQRKEALLATRTKLDGASLLLSRANETLDKLSVLPDLETDLQDIEKAQQRYDTLLSLYDSLGRATAKVEDLTRTINDYAGLEPAAWYLSEVDKDMNRLSALESLSRDYHKYTTVVNTANATIGSMKDLDIAADLLREVQEAYDRQQNERQALATYTAAQAGLDQATKNVAYLENLPQAEAVLLEIVADYDRLQTLRAAFQVYNVKADTLNRAQADVSRAATTVGLAEKELSAAWDAAGGVCPLCEQPIGDSAHTH